MRKNISQFIYHNLKSGKSLMVILTLIMTICGPVPAFMVFSNDIQRLNYAQGDEKYQLAKYANTHLLNLFDITDGNYYHIFLSIICAAAGLVIPFVLFHYFRKKDSADFFLSLPITRTSAYIANFISGFLYYIIPLVITSVITVAGLNIMGSWQFVNISQLLFMTPDHNGLLALIGNNIVFFLLFFALGCMSALLSSNGLNALVVYGTINFYPIAFMFLLTSAAEIFNNDIIDFQEPILKWCLRITPSLHILIFNEAPPTAWTYICALIFTVVFGVIGCYLCNRRPAETWSSAIIYMPVRLTLQYMYCFIVAFAAGLFFYYVTYGSIVNIIVGAVIGLVLSFVILNMIFERDMKAIFKKPLRLVWSAGIFAIVFIVIVMDCFGIFRYRQPEFSEVDYVNVQLNSRIVNYYTKSLKDEYGMSEIDQPEAKEAAIKLYSLFHEEIRNQNYNGILLVPYNLNTFEAIAQSSLPNTNAEVQMIRNGKEIRPLRNKYFKKKEEYYELFKTIYDSEQYVDYMIPILENSDIKGVVVTTKLIEEFGSGTGTLIDNEDMNKKFRDALLADYNNSEFDDMQNSSMYVLEVYYTLHEKYSENNEHAMITRDLGTTATKYIEAQGSITVIIPESFKNTLSLIQSNPAVEELESENFSIIDKISHILVSDYDTDGTLLCTSTITDRQRISEIMEDIYYGYSKSLAFPKYGTVLDIYFKEVASEDSVYNEKYYEPVQDGIPASRSHSIAFLERFSNVF